MTQLHEKARMQSQTHALLPRHVADSGQFRRTIVKLTVESRQVRVGQIGGELA